MEDRLGALGLALNCVVLLNSLYIDSVVKQLAADGFPVTDDDEPVARLSPLHYDYINLPGRNAFTRPPRLAARRLHEESSRALPGPRALCAAAASVVRGLPTGEPSVFRPCATPPVLQAVPHNCVALSTADAACCQRKGR
ncbi:Tn3 family transposase [Streptomyces sp. NPDC057539]|uniref:Tn3 family transposase n=1 Tax=Streptomyces sp. NPDC057539 TaxID=3346159 RepID=UPI0036C06B4D